MQAIDKLKKELPQFKWEQENKHSSIFGTLVSPEIQKRINHDTYWLNNVIIFISSKMGGKDGNPVFRYAICYQKGKIRHYRCKNKNAVEYGKIFVSGQNLMNTINKLIYKIDLNKFELK